jgi:hypothetical protein
MRALPLLIAAALFAPGIARACDEAERLRLTEEQKKLAQRNAWAGVERAYEALQDTKCTLEYANFFLGAESARKLGKVYEQYERLQQALAVAPEVDRDTGEDPRPKIQDSLDAIDGAYAKVEIRGDPRRRPVLSRPEMPFAPDQRSAIEWAQTVVAETGSFKGMLPFGKYVVGEQDFEIAASENWVVVDVGKVKHPGVATVANPDNPNQAQVGGTTTESAIRYASLVAVAGPAFLDTPETNVQVQLNGGDAFAPSDVFLSGFAVELGGELGLTYSEPALGVAMTVGYQGGFGTATFHVVDGWFAGVLRPGDLRLALGPMYQVSLGKGTGVASWFDRGQDPNVDPVGDIPYAGLGWGPGAKGSVGYGLLDLDKLQGVVEVGGAWQSDGARNYYTFGLRVGLVPTVPRFDAG